ncbi:CoA-transferase [Falsiroseomonas sp. HW251]|uniref:CoA-transferase n=1 Tax=Falsiroseomonas sp. HW251 TaxID=3390998 RepID=UPI003D31EC89
MLCGPPPAHAPARVVQALVARRARNLTVIAPDLASPGCGVSLLIEGRCVTRVVAAHLGRNPVARRRMMRDGFQLELTGQDRLIERIRATGHGFPPVPDRRGEAEPGRTEGGSVLVDLPLRAQFAVLAASEADAWFNLSYAANGLALATTMAQAADCVIAEVDILHAGRPLPSAVVQTSGVLVSYVVRPAR